MPGFVQGDPVLPSCSVTEAVGEGRLLSCVFLTNDCDCVCVRAVVSGYSSETHVAFSELRPLPFLVACQRLLLYHASDTKDPASWPRSPVAMGLPSTV